MGIFSANWLADMLLRIPGLLWALSFHEFCHGWAAYKLGDRTAAASGRLSLNPFDHLDPVGAIMLILFRFGWAKPVPIDSRWFKHPRRDIAIVSLAGPMGNFLTAAVCGVVFACFPRLLYPGPLRTVLIDLLVIDIGLGVFNLIPIPPLDGSKLLALTLPPQYLGMWFRLERWGMAIILLLVATGIIQAIMQPIMMLILRLVLFQF